MKYALLDSPIGELMMAGENKLEIIAFPKSNTRPVPGKEWSLDPEWFSPVIKQLTAYFDGRQHEFEIEMELKGTDFQKKVWNELAKVPYGQTISYGELASRIGNPSASRAVGMANAKNPIPIIIPCHRVIGKDGSLTGFGGGLDVKQSLIDLEKTHL